MAYSYGSPSDPTDVVGRRFISYAIDGLVVLAAAVVVLSLVRHDTFNQAPGDVCSILRARRVDSNGSSSLLCIHLGSRAWAWNGGSFLTAIYTAAIVGLLNRVVLQAVTGSSVGKHALGLQVVDEQGRSAGFGRTIVRELFLVVDGSIFLIGLIAVLVTHPHRRVGDFVAGTFVVARASAGRTVGVPHPAMAYGGSAFASPGQGAPGASGWVLPTAPAPLPQGWGMSTPPPIATPPVPTRAAESPWSVPPAVPPLRPPVAPQVPAQPPATPPPPPPAPVAPAPRSPAPPASVPSAPQSKPQSEPEPWWDKAIPAESPDREERS